MPERGLDRGAGPAPDGDQASGLGAAGAERDPDAAASARVHPRQWTSRELLGHDGEARISHAGAVYRLRVTALGKLILTK